MPERRHLAPPGQWYVLRGPAGYLGKAGTNLSLTGSADLIHASPFATWEEALADAARAVQILGMWFSFELRPAAELMPRKEKPGGPRQETKAAPAGTR